LNLGTAQRKNSPFLLIYSITTDAAERISTVSGLQHLSDVGGDLSSEVSSLSPTPADNISVE
jgi:hypothetical protein